MKGTFWIRLGATPLAVGVVPLLDHLPRVGALRQPWALGRNPFGIRDGEMSKLPVPVPDDCSVTATSFTFFVIAGRRFLGKECENGIRTCSALLSGTLMAIRRSPIRRGRAHISRCKHRVRAGQL